MTSSPPPAAPLPRTLPLVIGVGNEHRSDDRSGLEVARALRAPLLGKARVEECASEGIALLDVWREAERVLVVDAVRSGAPPGTVHRLDASAGSLPGFRSATSTHGLSLAEAVALANGLGCLPHHLVVYGIEVANVEMGDGLTPAVARGIREATVRILAEIEGAPAPASVSPRFEHA